MAKKYPKVRISKEAIKKIDNFKELANLKFRTDAFNIMNGLQPAIILGTKDIRLPKSKDLVKQIDVRYIFKTKK